MKHIFINDFLEQYYVFEEEALVNKGTFTDVLFLKDYTDFDLCYISNYSESLPQYEEQSLIDWRDRFVKSINKPSPCNLWFMGRDRKFHLLKPTQEFQPNESTENVAHICIGGCFDECDMHISMESFCSHIIELYKPAINNEPSFNIENAILELKDSASAIADGIDNIKQMLESKDGSDSDETNRLLKEELAAYRADFYLKSVQRLGLDALLDVMERLCVRLYNASQSSDDTKETLRYAINMIERTLRAKFRVRYVSSEPGVEFDSGTMIAYPDDSIFTEDVTMKGRVANSISPAVYWTIPRVNSDETEFLYREENVVLYQD